MEPIQLQRLVDGELSFEETQRILQFAESNPDFWRLIASSFVENQVWQSKFCDQHELAHDSDQRSKHSQAAGGHSRHPSMGWLALAASLLLAVSIIFLLTGPGPADHGAVPALLAGNQSEPIRNAVVDSDPQLDDLNQRPAVYHRVQVEDPTGHQYVNSDVPLYSVDPSELQKFVSKDYLPEDVRQRAADSGYGLQQNIRFLSGRLNDGRRFVIPVRKYSFFQGQ